LVVGGSNTGGRVPSSGGIEASELARGAAVSNNVVASGNVIEGVSVGGGGRIQPWVQEAEGGLVGVEALLVQEGDDRGKGGGRGRSSTNGFDASVLDNLEVDVTEGAGVRGGAVSGVVRARGREGNTRVEVGVDLILLLSSDGEFLGETSSGLVADRGAHDGLFGSRVSSDEAGGTDGGNVRAGGRERRIELAFAGSRFGFAARARVTRGEDDGDTTDASLLEFGVQSITVSVRGVVALGTVRDRVNLRGGSLVGNLGGPDQEIVPEVIGLEGV